MIAWLFRVVAIMVGIGVVGFTFYIKFRYDTPWVSVRNHHVKGFPWSWVLAALALIGWALGDLWLYGGPKARRQAKRQSDKDPAEQGQTEHAQTLAEDAGPEQAPTMQKPPTEP